MTAEEKTSLARFLDLAAASAKGGYLCHETKCNFYDDPPQYAAGAFPQGTTEKPQTLEQGAGPTPDPLPADTLEKIAEEINNCSLCRLCETRKKTVPGEGAASPLVMVIGEGPGKDEDASGRPFVGVAGQLLDKMLASIFLSRESNCFIANIVKCRPPSNRDPLPDETAFCRPYLERQIQVLKPRFILCAGRIAAQTLLRTTEPIGRLRGKFTALEIGSIEVPFIATYHPSALLRNEDLKRPAWEDLKLLRSAIDG